MQFLFIDIFVHFAQKLRASFVVIIQIQDYNRVSRSSFWPAIVLCMAWCEFCMIAAQLAPKKIGSLALSNVIEQEDPMRNGSVEQQAVDRVAMRIPGASSVLRSYGIDPTNRLSLAQAAAMVSATPDALLAELEAKARRLAHHSPSSTPAPQEEPELLEQAVGA
jgi:hypothetical protein